MAGLTILHFVSHDLFIKYDTDKDNQLSLNDVARAFYEISKKITSLPAVSRFSSTVLHKALIPHKISDGPSGGSTGRIFGQEVHDLDQEA